MHLKAEEPTKTLKMLTTNKSSGSDGLSIEFYRFILPHLKAPLLESLNYALKNNSLSNQQILGITTLIPNKDKDRKLFKTWRPISFLNID